MDTNTADTERIAIVTGASRGLGRALARHLVSTGWRVVIDARDRAALADAAAELGSRATAIAGDVADPAHRMALAGTARDLGRLDLLVNNASLLGPSPLPSLADLPLDRLHEILSVNTVSALGLIQQTLPLLVASAGTIVNVTSDAAVEAYEGWGGYGASKAALDLLTSVLAVEQPRLRVYALDPGDMRTRMHQDAYPGEDISDRPEPESVVPALLRLVEARPPSGRYRAGALLAAGAAG